MDERRLFIGMDYGTGAGAVPLLGNHNLDEANIIFWTPSTLASELAKLGTVIPAHAHSSLQQRLALLTRWVEQGHTLVLIGASTLPFAHYDKSGAGRQARLEEFAPLAGIDFSVATGTRVEYCGPSTLANVFTSLVPRMRYDCLLNSAELVPLLRVAAATTGTLQVIGGYRKVGLGLVFYIPPFNGTAPEYKILMNELARLPKLLRATPTELPVWMSEYQTEPERQTAEKIAGLERSAAELQVQITGEKETLAEYGALKHLVCSTGAAFASAVASALAELSLTVVDGPHPRADLLSAWINRFIAVEAKGVDGPVREAQLRQVERWVAEVNSTVELPAEEVKRDSDLRRYFEQLNKLGVPFDSISEDCKGLLVVGTFRATPLADRSEPDFPEPVLRLLSRSKICAITGVQLFTLVMQVREKPALKSEIVTELMSTCGVMARARDWSQYLKRSA
ncbi:hypothetical protein [Bradyrhizobium sp. B120]|uniref:hypothetical protein n=1 Tax=Bradyrhizobium sp. B120 TaxID=3410088 RepID=UPI003B984F27